MDLYFCPFSLTHTAVRNDRNKKRGKEKDQKNGGTNGAADAATNGGTNGGAATNGNARVVPAEPLVCSPEVESLICEVAKYHVQTFPNMHQLEKYKVVSLKLQLLLCAKV